MRRVGRFPQQSGKYVERGLRNGKKNTPKFKKRKVQIKKGTRGEGSEHPRSRKNNQGVLTVLASRAKEHIPKTGRRRVN